MLFFVDMLLPIVVIVDLLALLFLVTMMPTMLLLLVVHGCCSVVAEPQSDLVPESSATKQAHAQLTDRGWGPHSHKGIPIISMKMGMGGSPFSWGPQNFMTPVLLLGLSQASCGCIVCQVQCGHTL